MSESLGKHPSPEGFAEKERSAEILEVKKHKEGITLYIFKDLAIAIDVTGRNYKELPELFAGPYDNETNTGSLSKADFAEVRIDMSYMMECIKEVAKTTGIQQFWFDPFDGDSKTGNEERRKRARLKLFTSHGEEHIQPAPEGHGYVLTV